MTIPASKQVNRIGKYLYNNLGGALNIKTHANTCDVYTLVLYQVPRPYQIPGKQKEGYNDIHEMTINISITTYQNKIRIDTISMDPQERTLGFDLYEPDQMNDLDSAVKKIYSRVCRRLAKAFKQYNFLF